jgi:Domain of Unknown Function (DUF326)
MTKVTEMLERYPRPLSVDAQLLAKTLDALSDCQTTCIQCADACLAEDDLERLVKCINLNLDCADICSATSRVLSRQTEYDPDVTRPLLDACITVCKSCGDECDHHAAHMPHCATCAESCRRCEQACRELLEATS